ncbi:MAG: hypothetical protein KatS3mg129_2645 [Leptospiraceae bacterium]|nr:MAG: hypothetical protein KatS3mg129_2645 [Leptospiraceae bacterium]
MKKIFIIILLFINLLKAEDLFYTKYLNSILTENLEIQLQKKQKEKVDLYINKKESLFQEPITLEGAYTTGKLKTPYNGFSIEFPSQQMIRQYSIGISKVIDVLNQQKTQKEIYKIQKQIENEYLNLLKTEKILQFRNVYFNLVFLNLIKEHLEEHILKFNQLKFRFRKNYFDKKLGYYTIPALELGINTLQSELKENISLLNQNQMVLFNLLSIDSNKSIQLDPIQKIETLLPLEKDLSLEELLSLYTESSIYKIENLKLQIIQNNIDLYKKLQYDGIEVFFTYTNREQGKYQSSVFDVATPEKEVLWSMGIRIPIPYGSERKHDISIQQKEYEIQQLKIKELSLKIKNQIRNAYMDYINHLAQYKKNIQLLKNYEPYLKMLEKSLIKRRITYFEFWGEHEKFHNLLIMTGHSFQKQ